MRGEAVDIRRPDGRRVQVVTDAGLTVEADHIVLCCGNLQSREYSGFETTQGFYANPYPIRRLARAATSKSSVAILGARLSAIDVALGLAGSGFRGSMTMFSRSGYFPSVRGTQGRYVPTILTEDRLRAHHEKYGAIRLAQVLKWTMEELALAGSPTLAFGTPRNAALLDSRLVQSLLVSGFARAHRHGGLEVDTLTGALIDQGGRICGDVSALGELTSGVHFFTSVLEINARHAARMAKRGLQAPRALKHAALSAFCPVLNRVPGRGARHLDAGQCGLTPSRGLQC